MVLCLGFGGLEGCYWSAAEVVEGGLYLVLGLDGWDGEGGASDA